MRQCVALAMLICVLIAPGGAHAQAIPPPSTGPTLTSLASDGVSTAWSEYHPDGATIFLTIPGQARSTIATGVKEDEHRSQLGVAASTVVWLDWQNGQGSIMARTVGGAPIAVAQGDVALPAISGSTVVWVEGLTYQPDDPNSTTPAHIMARDLTSMAAPYVLAETPKAFFGYGKLIASDGWVVWSYGTGVTKLWVFGPIKAVPLNGGAVQTVVESADITSFDAAGAKVAWREGVAISPTTQIMVADLNAQTKTLLEPNGALGVPSIDGRYVVVLRWERSERWVYDLDTHSAYAFAPCQAICPQLVRGGNLISAQTSVAGYSIQQAPVVTILPIAPRPQPNDGRAWFRETGHTLGGEFRSFWTRSGGLPIFGFPLTEEFSQRPPGATSMDTTQYTERQRFEYHPENVGTPYSVLLGRLGADALAARGVDWQALPKADPTTLHYMPQTGQAIAPEFWAYWRSHGLELGDPGVSQREALALWGYPLTPARYEQTPNGQRVLVQWYERARFEYHPENVGTPYTILLGRLGAESLSHQYEIAP